MQTTISSDLARTEDCSAGDLRLSLQRVWLGAEPWNRVETPHAQKNDCAVWSRALDESKQRRQECRHCGEEMTGS